MERITSRVGELYFYRSFTPSRTHRFSVSAYLVERMTGSPLVARIEPLGLVPQSAGEQELARVGRRMDLVLTGPWRRTPSRRHARVLVRPTDRVDE